MSISRDKDTCFCNLCVPPHRVATIDLIEHFALVHGMDDVKFETWPDGEPVILDQTLEPDDFDVTSEDEG